MALIATLRYKALAFLYEQFTRTAHSLTRTLPHFCQVNGENPGAALPLRALQAKCCYRPAGRLASVSCVSQSRASQRRARLPRRTAMKSTSTRFCQWLVRLQIGASGNRWRAAAAWRIGCMADRRVGADGEGQSGLGPA